ncbi:MAG: transcriptional repressor [Gammaproteobacteria bacterium]|nr:MAG: transcriptional repressor [Gammaproteobacteria bacterium]
MDNLSATKRASQRDMASMLKSHGILPTQQRLLIARALFGRDQHLSADQVLNRVNDDRDRVSKATVYNTLGLFARKGLVREVVVDPSRLFYDTNVTDHHHFYNVDTGELRDIKAAEVQINALPELPKGTTAEGVNVIIRVSNAGQQAS